MKAFYLLLLCFLSYNITAQTTWDGASWSSGVPDNTIDATITGSYNTLTHGEFTTKNLTVAAAGNIVIESNTKITIQTNLINSGSFVIENTGSLIMIDDSGTVTGDVTVKRNTPNNPAVGFTSFFSSPIIESDSNMSTIFNSDDTIYYWDTSVSPTLWVGPIDKSMTNVGLGKGYAVRPDATSGVVTRTFTGELNTGDISVPVYYSDSSTSPGQFGYNIIGNPYPSAINWYAFKADNASLLSGTMYLWRQQASGGTNHASSYIALNSLGTVPYNSATEFIGSAQGFVAKTNATSNVIFKNAHRVSDNTQFFRDNNRANIAGNSWLKIEGDSNMSTILIGFNANATTNFDNDYDGVFIGGTDDLRLYSLSGMDKLLINGLPELVEPNNVNIPLGIFTTTAGNYTIAIDEEFISANYLILLEDTQENVTTNLRNLDYTFASGAMNLDESRFIVKYEYDTSLSVETETIQDADVKLFFDDNLLNIVVSTGEVPNEVQLINMNGKLLFTKSNESKIETHNLSSGVYIVKMQFEGKSLISKSILKN